VLVVIDNMCTFLFIGVGFSSPCGVAVEAEASALGNMGYETMFYRNHLKPQPYAGSETGKEPLKCFRAKAPSMISSKSWSQVGL
jgi:hypothetical protein